MCIFTDLSFIKLILDCYCYYKCAVIYKKVFNLKVQIWQSVYISGQCSPQWFDSLDLCAASLACTVSGRPPPPPPGSIEVHFTAGQQEILLFSNHTAELIFVFLDKRGISSSATKKFKQLCVVIIFGKYFFPVCSLCVCVCLPVSVAHKIW